MPYARVSIGATTVFADAVGAFTIPTAGADPVTISSPVSGRYFAVSDQGGPLDVISQLVTPSGAVDLVHNAANTSEFVRSQFNAYLHANVARDYLLRFNPTYPTIAAEVGMPIAVNINDDCNAFYSSDTRSINFFRALGGCNNTGFATVVHHEYGHHTVQMAGSGQGAYGEGMGDVLAVLVTDVSQLAIGFRSCGGGIRDANNACRYNTNCSDCGSEVHACGTLISGCVWSVRTNLLATNPSDYRDIISSLAINSMLLHSGTAINSQITIDYLTLDDDDADISNGTPHYAAINDGFSAHNMPAPALAQIGFVYPEGRPALSNPAGGTSFTVQVIPLTGTPLAGTGTLFYNVGGGFVSTPMTELSPNLYHAMLPPSECGSVISYYVGAQSTSLADVTSPLTAPAAAFSATSATAIDAAISDTFETDTGWTAGIPGDTASTGQWVRVDPIGTTAQPENDVTPAPGAACFVTGQGPVDGGDGVADVDGGATTLLSPHLRSRVPPQPAHLLLALVLQRRRRRAQHGHLHRPGLQQQRRLLGHRRDDRPGRRRDLRRVVLP